MAAYYNENNPYAAQWLRNLIAGGHIAAGDVDERSITDVRADDLRPYTQCHFFAGIGAWSYALRLAGWSDDKPVWTGSCPCQPFSVAGQGKGVTDERHLWPVWYNLIRERQPTVIFGEQVEAAIANTGSILFKMTWKVRVTPSGRSVCLLHAQAHRISDKDCGSWLTPTTNVNDQPDTRRGLSTLTGQAKYLAGWTTPIMNDSTNSQYSTSNGRKILKLPGQVMLAHWTTPTSTALTARTRPPILGTRKATDPQISLADMVYHLVDSGIQQTGCTAVMENTGQLNPAHSRWLMGLPPEWDDCAPMAMPSTRKQRQK